LFNIIQEVSLQANRALKPLFERQVAEVFILDFVAAAIPDFKIILFMTSMNCVGSSRKN